MQEVKEICDRILTVPAPPMTTPQELLTRARRARVHRRAAMGAGIALSATVFAVAFVVLLLVPGAPKTINAEPSAVLTSATEITASEVSVSELELITKRELTQGLGVFALRVSQRSVPPPADNSCQAPLPFAADVPEVPGSCEVITLHGEAIRTGLLRINPPAEEVDEVLYALRYHNAKAILVIQPRNWASPGTTGPPPLSRQELAEILFQAVAK